MPKRLYLVLLLFLQLVTLPVFATVFTVTSNADTGPGTLRQALLDAAANGSAEKDYIYFNLPDLSEAGRTIKLVTQLPDLSANLVLDASTQPGAKFGLSDTHVLLLYDIPDTQKLSGLRAVGQHDVEIYSLYIKGITTISNSQTSSYGYWRGIEFKNGKNIQIGAAGKGNVVLGFSYDITINPPDNTFEYFDNLTVKSNFFGIDVDGETLSSYIPQQTYFYFVTSQTIIGGTEAEGNLFAQGLAIYQINNNNYTDTDSLSYYVSAPATIQIKNNKIGVDYLAQKRIAGTSGLTLRTEQPGGKTNYTIEDNIIVNEEGFSAIYVENNGYPVYINRNYIGTDKTRQNKLPTASGIYIRDADQVYIGSDNPADANYITGCKPVNVGGYATASVNKNSFYCTVNAYPMVQNYYTRPVTQIKILNINAGSVKGTATPKSKIELFYSDACGTCSPQTYFASTIADENGNWLYNGPIAGTVIASATYNNSTSEFTQTQIDAAALKITNACNGSGGAVKGLVPQSAVNMKWVNANGDIVGNNADLVNVPPGKYKLLATNGNCNAESTYYEVVESIQLNTANIKKNNPSCSLNNGSVKGLTVISKDLGGQVIYSWKDASGAELAQTADLNNVPAGTYTVTVTSPASGCSKIYGPVTLINTTGPNVDQSTVAVTPTNCGESKGSITNIIATGTGTLKYSWKNAQGTQVATTADLINQPSGVYTLQVTDDTNCGPVYTSAITIKEVNGIVLTDNGSVTPVTCSGNKGTITGITALNAAKYQWYDAQNVLVSASNTTADFATDKPGTYHLIATNGACSITGKNYIIPQQSNTTDYGGLTKTLKDATCTDNNGSILATFTDATKPKPVSVRWVQNSTGNTIGTNMLLGNIDAGTYNLYATDNNGCEKFIIAYSIGRVAGVTIKTDQLSVINDQCNLHKGRITGVQATGIGSVTYKWVNSAGSTVGTTADLTDMPAGTYKLYVNDANCSAMQSFTISNIDVALTAPQVSNIQLCSAGSALLNVNNTSKDFGYRLYADAGSATPLAEEKSGSFKINVKSAVSYYISQYQGDCESARAEVKVTLGGLSTSVANTFTPNGDGINDTWKINSIESYPNAVVQIFTRAGEKVFESTGYAVPFDGSYHGQSLPTGTYYYIINLNSGCSLLSGSVTLIR